MTLPGFPGGVDRRQTDRYVSSVDHSNVLDLMLSEELTDVRLVRAIYCVARIRGLVGVSGRDRTRY